jgi:hypothetical protein
MFAGRGEAHGAHLRGLGVEALLVVLKEGIKEDERLREDVR